MYIVAAKCPAIHYYGRHKIFLIDSGRLYRGIYQPSQTENSYFFNLLSDKIVFAFNIILDADLTDFNNYFLFIYYLGQNFDHMEFAVVSLPAAPVRTKPNHRKEMVNQLLFGESVRILKTKVDLWVKVRSLHDAYEGWMTNTMLESATEEAAMARTVF